MGLPTKEKVSVLVANSGSADKEVLGLLEDVPAGGSLAREVARDSLALLKAQVAADDELTLRLVGDEAEHPVVVPFSYSFVLGVNSAADAAPAGGSVDRSGANLTFICPLFPAGAVLMGVSWTIPISISGGGAAAAATTSIGVGVAAGGDAKIDSGATNVFVPITSPKGAESAESFRECGAEQIRALISIDGGIGDSTLLTAGEFVARGAYCVIPSDAA